MILSNNNGTFTPVAGGNATFVGTKASFDAVKDTLPDNTVAYITDDGNGDLQPVDAVADGNMSPPTSNAVYDAISALISKGEMPSPTITHTAAADIGLTNSDVTFAGINIGRLGGNAIHFSWTTNGYLALCVDTTVVAAIRGGTVIK